MFWFAMGSVTLAGLLTTACNTSLCNLCCSLLCYFLWRGNVGSRASSISLQTARSLHPMSTCPHVTAMLINCIGLGSVLTKTECLSGSDQAWLLLSWTRVGFGQKYADSIADGYTVYWETLLEHTVTPPKTTNYPSLNFLYGQNAN